MGQPPGNGANRVRRYAYRRTRPSRVAFSGSYGRTDWGDGPVMLGESPRPRILVGHSLRLPSELSIT